MHLNGRCAFPKCGSGSCLFSINNFHCFNKSFLFSLASSQRASVMGMPTPVTLTWMRGWHQATAVVVSATTVSTTQRDNTASAASQASTETCESPSLPQMLANVSQQSLTDVRLLLNRRLSKVRSSCSYLEQSSCFSKGWGALSSMQFEFPHCAVCKKQ